MQLHLTTSQSCDDAEAASTEDAPCEYDKTIDVLFESSSERSSTILTSLSLKITGIAPSRSDSDADQNPNVNFHRM